MFYLLKLSLFILITAPAAVATVLLGLIDRHGKLAYSFSRFWCALILIMGGIRLNVAGREHIDPRRQYIFMVNHQSNIDIPVLVRSLAGFQLRWIAKRELLWIPFFGWAMWASKHIMLDRADPLDAVKSIERARDRIAAGISVVVFPEGTRSRDGRLLRFKKGGFLLAVKANRPIVPVTIIGSRQLLSAGAWRLQRGTIDVIIGRPIEIAGFRPGNLRHLSALVRQAIESHLSCLGRDTTEPARDSQQRIDKMEFLKERSI